MTIRLIPIIPVPCLIKKCFKQDLEKCDKCVNKNEKWNYTTHVVDEENVNPSTSEIKVIIP